MKRGHWATSADGRAVADAKTHRSAAMEAKRTALLKAARYDTDLTAGDLSRRFHVSGETVLRWLKEAGLRP